MVQKLSICFLIKCTWYLLHRENSNQVKWYLCIKNKFKIYNETKFKLKQTLQEMMINIFLNVQIWFKKSMKAYNIG